MPLNYAFMPAYPLSMRVVAAPLGWLGMEPIPAAVVAGVAVSLAATLVAMLAHLRDRAARVLRPRPAQRRDRMGSLLPMGLLATIYSFDFWVA